MANEVANMLQGQKPAEAFRVLDHTESLAEGIGSSYAVIQYKGKVWSLRYKGDRKTFVRPDDGSPSNHIDVIMLRQAHAKSKSYYPDYNQDASDGKRPICSSINGIVPDLDVQEQQAPNCAICPRNVWKTNSEGRKSRECQDYKRMAVLLLPAQTKALLGAPLMEPVFLRIPPASLNDLSSFGETMSNQGWHFAAFVTRISFDPDVAHPKFLFKAIQGLSNAEAPVVLPMVEDPLAKRITGEDQANTPRPLAAVTAAPQTAVLSAPAAQPQAQAAVVQTVVAKPAPVQETTKSPSDLGLTATQATATTQVTAQGQVVQQEVIPPVVKKADPVDDTPPVTGILELVANVTEANGAPGPIEIVKQTVADTGEPTNSNAALDARVASLLKVPA